MNTETLSFRDHVFIRRNQQICSTLSENTIFTNIELFKADERDDEIAQITKDNPDFSKEKIESLVRPIEKGDMPYIESAFGKECPKTTQLQFDKIIEFIGMPLNDDGTCWTTSGTKSANGLIVMIENLIGRFENTESTCEEIIELQAQSISRLFAFPKNVKLKKPKSFYCDPVFILKQIRIIARSCIAK